MKNGFQPNRGPRNMAATAEERRQSKSTLIRLTKYVLKNYRISYVVVMVCILVSSVTTLLSTLFTKTLIDDYIVPLTHAADPQYSSLWQALFRLGLVLLFGVICSYTYNLIMIRVSQGSLLRLRRQLFTHMESLPIKYFDQRAHGDIMSVYTNDIDTLRQLVGQALPQLFNSAITITVTLVSMLVLSVPLTCVSIVMAAVMMIATKQLSTRSRKHFTVQQQSLARVNSFIEEMMTGQKVVKVFCHEKQAMQEFEQINEQLRSSAYNANRIANIVMPVNGNLGQLTYVLIAIVGATFALGNFGFGITLGTIVSFLTLNKNFTQPVSQISNQINSIIMAAAGADRVFALLDAEPETDEGKITLQKKSEKEWTWSNGTPVEGGVKFDKVDFGYTPEKQVLFDIDIDAMPDQKIAFVGGTGAGKTTILNLVTRFYDIQDGKIQYDGININDISKSDLRRSFGMVLQETRLFTGTVLDNIRYGRLDATDEECIETAKLVGAHDFIRRLANGYQTVLSGDGGNLSAGERQLIAVARAAIADPPVLILDEATSSIDTRTERIVQKGMDSMMQGRTTFVIAHRLSTVRNSDCIIVLEHGKIIERGSHQELLELKGKYYQLYTGNGIN